MSDDETCPCLHCVALDMLEMAIVNCAAAGVHPSKVREHMATVMGEMTELSETDTYLRDATPAGNG